MVTLSQVRESNNRLSSLPAPLVAVFIGATSGIGEATMKQFAEMTVRPRIYFLGRDAEAAARIEADLRTRRPDGEFFFIQVKDLCLMSHVDEISREILSKEDKINLLFISAGNVGIKKKFTSEGLDKYAALGLYARVRFIQHLLPTVRNASSSGNLGRIIIIYGGAKGSACDESDLGGRNQFSLKFRMASGTMMNLALEKFSEQVPNVSFVHVYPGFVRTNNQKLIPGIAGVIIRALIWVLSPLICVSLQESGERNLFHATSARYPPSTDVADGAAGHERGVQLPSGVDVATGSVGRKGSGVYLLNWDGETQENAILTEYRKNGMKEKIWRHFEEEFSRIESTYTPAS